MTPTHRFAHPDLMGTHVEVTVGCRGEDLAKAVDASVVAEIQRLVRVFSVFESGSELSRWRNGRLANPSPELGAVLAVARDWQGRSGGRFNPLAGRLVRHWRSAEVAGAPPAADVLSAVVDAIRAPAYDLGSGRPVVVGDCADLDLNGIAKGFIVDRAMDAGVGPDVSWLTVNAGGDLAHRGAGQVRVGIENPHRPYDNEPPLTVLGLADAAVATSGRARRGFRVGGQWFGHVVDPLTGWPVTGTESATVVAGDAMTADVLATIAAVMVPEEAVEFLGELDGVEALVIDHDRGAHSTAGWPALLVGPRETHRVLSDSPPTISVDRVQDRQETSHD